MLKLEAGNTKHGDGRCALCKSISISVSKIVYAGKTLLMKIKTDSELTCCWMLSSRLCQPDCWTVDTRQSISSF